MIRPAIRNVFDSQSTRKSRATWSKKYKRISLSLPPQWSIFDNIIRKIASLDPHQFLGKSRKNILRHCTNIHDFSIIFWAFKNYRRFSHFRQCFNDFVTWHFFFDLLEIIPPSIFDHMKYKTGLFLSFRMKLWILDYCDKYSLVLFLALLNFAATQSGTCTWRQISENMCYCYITPLF